jgi:phage tail-like protein
MTFAIAQRLRKVVVPDVVGLTADNAQVMLRNAGLQAGTIVYTESYDSEDSVVRAEPAPGQMVSSDAPVRLWVSKPSLVRFLPGIYQMSGVIGEGDFLHRMLRVFQHVFESVKGNVDQIDAIFKPLETPQSFIPWLASWLALTVDTDWPEQRARRVLKGAAALFAIRGTRRSMEQLIDIFAGYRPEIRENEFPYLGFRVGVGRVGVDSMVLPQINLAHCFVVNLPVEEEQISDNELIKLHQVIRQEKPAHTLYCVQFAERRKEWAEAPFMRIGVSSRIGEESQAEPESTGADSAKPFDGEGR